MHRPTASKPLSSILLAVLLATTAASALGRDFPPGNPRPRRVQCEGAIPSPDRTEVVLRINGNEITRERYEQVQRDGAFSWNALVGIHGEEKLHPKGQTREELLLLAELAEPLAMKARFPHQAEDLERQAWEMYHRAMAGEDWSLLVKKYTTEPGNKSGDVGRVAFTNLVHPFNRVMFSAPVGVPQPPVETVFGYHVGKVLEIIPPRTVPDGNGGERKIPELRVVNQALLVWITPEDEYGNTTDLRLEATTIERHVKVEVVDESLCGELPNLCALQAVAGAPQPTP